MLPKDESLDEVAAALARIDLDKKRAELRAQFATPAGPGSKFKI